MSSEATQKSEYTVEPFEATDVEAFLDLHGRIFDPDHDREWFAWKYADNPYVDHRPILVAKRDGDLVGARPFFALDVVVDGKRHLALQPGDTMVHPDHRRKGLFTRMTEAAIERYTDGEPSFFFNFPNGQSGPGYLKLGWRTVAEAATYYRIQHPSAVGLDGSGSALASLASSVAGPLLDGYNRFSNARLRGDSSVAVTRHRGVPPSLMAEIGGEPAPGGIHVARDEQFYAWRFDNPEWEYAAYVAEVRGDPVAGLVVGTSVGPGDTTTKVTDVAPLPPALDDRVLETLLGRVVADYADSDVLAAPAILPESTMRAAGFLRDDRPPLSLQANQTTHVVRSLTGDWTPEGVDLTDEDSWRLTFSEHDTS
ncbi:GNAT family N-acetyltransferase [Halobacterium jilantaiense]|uniref:Ribosomal protein S18 acetylase RimI n=1 Tax=Halobacterium jilantaiense TaxID=355548 RepID=A0A1I0PL41_9EURY|nr:GNAT family N-acetyltransferase [Halobacterium jilantaiense]SEW15092.1 Ribosomal protein S18 acetylase RimI [Halobacterium jilantaiense]